MVNESICTPHTDLMHMILTLRHHLGDIGLCVNAVVSDVLAADHKHRQGLLPPTWRRNDVNA